MKESQLIFVAASFNNRWWFSEVFEHPSQNDAGLTEGSKVAAIRYQFTWRDLTRLSGSFGDIMGCRWWSLFIPCSCTLSNIVSGTVGLFAHTGCHKVEHFTPSLLVNQGAFQESPVIPSHPTIACYQLTQLSVDGCSCFFSISPLSQSFLAPVSTFWVFLHQFQNLFKTIMMQMNQFER